MERAERLVTALGEHLDIFQYNLFIRLRWDGYYATSLMVLYLWKDIHHKNSLAEQ